MCTIVTMIFYRYIQWSDSHRSLSLDITIAILLELKCSGLYFTIRDINSRFVYINL